MKNLKKQEQELMKELWKWLPKTIFDTHFHCRPKYLLNQSIINKTAKTPGETFSYFSWEDHQKMINILLPDFICKFVVFGFVLTERELENNRYVHKLAMNNNNNIVPVFSASTDDIVSEIQNNVGFNYRGLKIKTQKNKEKKNYTNNILDFYSKEVFEHLNKLKSFIIIHLPENIFYNVDELLFLAKKYYNITFIIAHLGNSYLYQNDFDLVLKKIILIPNIYFDTSMITDEKVITTAISILGDKKILYGSDAPYSYLRGEFNCGSDGKIFFDPDILYSWVDKERYHSYSHKHESFAMVHIKSLIAIKNALRINGKDDDQIKNNIFYQNILSLKII